MNTSLKLGEHYICDLSNCNRETLLDSERANAIFSRTVRESGLTVVDEGFYKFSPHGFTCFLLLAESHASLHAWPEYGYCAIDLFTCAIGKDLVPVLEQIKQAFGATDMNIRLLDRHAEIASYQMPIPAFSMEAMA